MEADEAYKYVQDLFRRGLVTIIGSGSSCALGLPSMGELSIALCAEIPLRLRTLTSQANVAWTAIEERLTAGEGLEVALASTTLPEDLADLVTDVVASVVGAAEGIAISTMSRGGGVPALGSLFQHVLQNNDVADVITTNYDRLLEVAAGLAAVRVDTMFYGHTVGRLDERLAREELLEPLTFVRRAASVRLSYRPHIRIAKPHGSLDWFAHNGSFVRAEIQLPGARQIVAPGGSKYRLGYDMPFDLQRTRANLAIDQAAAFLVIGYGFNDDHLETHLKAKFAQVPAVVVSRELTPNARGFLSLNPGAIGIEADSTGIGSRIIRGNDEIHVAEELWQLEVILKEILGK